MTNQQTWDLLYSIFLVALAFLGIWTAEVESWRITNGLKDPMWAYILGGLGFALSGLVGFYVLQRAVGDSATVPLVIALANSCVFWLAVAGLFTAIAEGLRRWFFAPKLEQDLPIKAIFVAFMTLQMMASALSFWSFVCWVILTPVAK